MGESRAALEQLSTEELRSRAFTLAEKRHDIGFFWDLVKHLPASRQVAADDSFSGPGTAIADVLELFREFRGEHLSAAEPLLRAKFLDYVESHTR